MDIILDFKSIAPFSVNYFWHDHINFCSLITIIFFEFLYLIISGTLMTTDSAGDDVFYHCVAGQTDHEVGEDCTV